MDLFFRTCQTSSCSLAAVAIKYLILLSSEFLIKMKIKSHLNVINFHRFSKYQNWNIPKGLQSWRYTANVCRELQGLYKEIGVQGFQSFGDCIPVFLKSPQSDFHCNICREFDIAGILQEFPALDVGKPCNNINFWRYTCKICRDSL